MSRNKNKKRRQALVAHPNPITRKRLARLTRECGYGTLETGDFFSACRALFYGECELFVCGLDLGDFTIAEILAALRKSRATMPRTIVVSNEWVSHPDAHISRMLAHGCLPEAVSAEAFFTTVLVAEEPVRKVKQS